MNAPSNTIIHQKDNSVFSAWDYASKVSGGRKRRTTKKSRRQYKRAKIGKGRRTRRA